MPTLPANFFRRRELQALVNRSVEAIYHAEPELARYLQALLTATASLEGYLAECPPDGRQPAVFENPGEWTCRWSDSSITLHTEQGDLRIAYGQQILHAYDEKHTLQIGTGRFRVVLGEAIHVSTNRDDLQPHVVRYVASFSGLPAGMEETLLNHIFGAPNSAGVIKTLS